MFKELIKKSVYFGVFIIVLAGVISCEKDFQDIGSNVINNTKFDTNDTILEIKVKNQPVTSVRGDGIALGGPLGQYLIGVFNDAKYEKIEASMVSQINVLPGLRVNEREEPYGVDTTVVTTIDTAYIKLPYHATVLETTAEGAMVFELDSIIGDTTKAFTLNVYQSDTYLSKLNPSDPSKANSYQSNDVYQKLSGELNATPNFQFKPNANDTVMIVKRRMSSGFLYDLDTVELQNKNPFATIPLNETKIKQIFLDKYGTADFASQVAFNEYFKGMIIEATGNEGSLISFQVNNPLEGFRPSIEIFYTNTIFKGSKVIDTVKMSNTFFFSDFSNSIYKMTERTYPADKNVIIQGAAGSVAEIDLFGEDINNNNIADQIELLRNENWLVNEASLTFYVNQEVVQFDTITTPFRLFLYKKGDFPSQIKDVLSEGEFSFDGALQRDEDKKPGQYTFRITDYISDLLQNETNYNPTLRLKVYNKTDSPGSVVDTILRDYNWNPKAVTLLNHLMTNGDRRARLKISYTKKKE